MANALNKVNSDGVEDGSIVNADINASAAITTSKITGLATSATTDTTDASNIGSGTLAAARVAGLPADKITSGTIATARLGTGTSSSSNFLRGDGSWQPAAYDDSNLRRDLNVLALQTAVDTNRKAYNLQNSFLDHFEDATGIGSLTTASRNNNEYVDTTYTQSTTPSRTQDADSTGTDGNYSWFRWTDPSGTGSYQSDANETAEVLIVAGGGGGGTSGGEGGGGGAGGLIYYGAETPKTPNGSAATLTANQAYTATVGVGGTGATSYGANGGNGTSGGNSSFTGSGLSLTVALGGGTGGNYPNHTVSGSGNGVDGGSGGGGGGNYSGGNNAHAGGSGTSGQGHDGGDGYTQTQSSFEGGGGGGAGGAGGTGSSSGSFIGGNGGVGLEYGITGTNTYFAGGGGGWTNGGTHGSGGNGGGGAGGASGTDGLGGGGGGGGGKDGGDGTVIIRVLTQQSVTSIQATGTVVGAASTASSSRTKVSGTFLYKNHAGTATLGTDLKLYFTCNGGTNWTEAASYTAGSDFSTGIKTVYLGETTCTAGTDVRYKAVWANQAAGSKETQLHGVAVNY